MANRDMGQQAMETDDQFTVTLARGLQLLQAFSVDRPVLTNAELVQRCGLNKATVSRLAFTLIELGYLRRQGPRSAMRWIRACSNSAIRCWPACRSARSHAR